MNKETLILIAKVFLACAICMGLVVGAVLLVRALFF